MQEESTSMSCVTKSTTDSTMLIPAASRIPTMFSQREQRDDADAEEDVAGTWRSAGQKTPRIVAARRTPRSRP